MSESKVCNTCKGKGSLMVWTKTLAGMREINRSCYVCYGSGKYVETFSYKSLAIRKIGEKDFYVDGLDSDFCSLEGCHKAIDSVEKDWIQFNSESEPDDKYPSLLEYCKDYLAQMDY